MHNMSGERCGPTANGIRIEATSLMRLWLSCRVFWDTVDQLTSAHKDAYMHKQARTRTNARAHANKQTNKRAHTHTHTLELQANPGAEFSWVISTPSRVNDSTETSGRKMLKEVSQ